MIGFAHNRLRFMRHDAGSGAGTARTLVLGAGVTGLACARHLLRSGLKCRVADNREAPPRLDELRTLLPAGMLALGAFDEALLRDVDRVVVSPGLAPDLPLLAVARARGMPVLGELDLFVQACEAPVIAITGTNGKSTVTRLVADMLNAGGLHARAGGNLGPAALELLDGEPADAFVLEVSSFQLEQSPRLPCRAAAVLNVSPDHLDRHATLAAYAALKARVYDHAETCVVNLDDPLVRRMVPDARGRIGFTLGAPAGEDYGLMPHEGEPWLCRGDRPLMRAAALPFSGRHNLANALAGLALAEAAGISPDDAVRGAAAFVPLPHRCQPVPSADGRTWINDSKGTNLAATLAAVEGVDGPLVLIAGGVAKDRDFSALARALDGRARGVVLIGRDAPLLAEAMNDAVPVHYAGSMAEAVRVARAISRDGDTVLLSPACASQDMFADYRERGEAFVAAVAEAAA